MTKMELYLSCIRRKKGKAKKENEAIGLGVALEPLIRQEFAIDYPNFIVRSPKGYEMYRRRDKTFMTATLDGTITDKLTKEKLILEIKTHYEMQWLQRGLTIKYLKFHLPHAGELQEPDIEIEPDTYRSYNRGNIQMPQLMNSSETNE